MRFDLSAGTLELRRNGVSGTALAVVDGIDDFQVTLLLQDSSSATTFTVNDDWSQIQSVQFLMTGRRDLRDRSVMRTMTAAVLPRNVLSH